MSAAHGPALPAIASQLIAALESYDEDMRCMLESWPDLDRYHAVSAQIEQIRMYSSSLPDVRVQWVDLLIAHAELLHLLWRTNYGKETELAAQVDDVRERHADCLRALRNRCARVRARGNGWLA